MDKAAKLKLKQFIDDNIPFKELKAAGFFDKDIRKTDYDKIAARVCHWFGYKSIYEYKPTCRGKRCDGDCSHTSPYCKSYNPLKWQKLEVNEIDLITKDSWLN